MDVQRGAGWIAAEEGSQRGAAAPVGRDRGVLRTVGGPLLLTAVYNTAIALVITLVDGKRFGATLVYSHCIGFSIHLLAIAFKRLRAPAPPGRSTLAAVPLGGFIGFVLASRLLRVDVTHQVVENPRAVLVAAAGALTFGTLAWVYFSSRSAAAEREAELREEQVRRLQDEQRLTEANLKLLQAQIEPHFLFNTLSTVIQLVEDQPAGAKRMLLNLTSYLRGSLHRTRSGDTSLGEELELVRAYLEIQVERMGARLRYRIDADAAVRGLPLPPLLLQPLVENAVQHGLEPKPGGGEVSVSARREGDLLVVEVRDTGLGMPASSAPGVGLANVRARVTEISRGRGRFVIRPNGPQGLWVELAVPVAQADAPLRALEGGHREKAHGAAGG